MLLNLHEFEESKEKQTAVSKCPYCMDGVVKTKGELLRLVK